MRPKYFLFKNQLSKNEEMKKWVKNKEYLVLCHYLSSFVNIF